MFGADTSSAFFICAPWRRWHRFLVFALGANARAGMGDSEIPTLFFESGLVPRIPGSISRTAATQLGRGSSVMACHPRLELRSRLLDFANAARSPVTNPPNPQEWAGNKYASLRFKRLFQAVSISKQCFNT